MRQRITEGKTMTTNEIGFYAELRNTATVRLALEHQFDYTNNRGETIVITRVSADFSMNGTVSVFGDGVVRKANGLVGVARRTCIYLKFAELPVRVQIDVMEALRCAHLLAMAKANNENEAFLKAFDTFALAN